MKKSSRRRRFFALDERTPSAYLRDQHAAPNAPRPKEDPEDEDAEDEEEFEEGAADGGSEQGDLPPGFELSRLPRPRRIQKKRRVTLVKAGGIAVICLLMGVLIGFLGAGARENERPLAPVKPAEKVKPLTAEEQAELDAAYEARYQHRSDEARERFSALARKHPDWKWLDLEQNETLLFAGKVIDARLALLQETDQSANPAQANYLLATAYMVEKAYPRAEILFGIATAYDPTRPEYYYLWGDCLRMHGKPLEAAGKFRAALLRNTFEFVHPFYQLKLWLCEIDADQEDASGLNAGLDGELAKPRPSMPVLFAAGGRAIKRGEFEKAAGYLKRARPLTDPMIFHILLGDPIFQQASGRPELAELFQPEKAGVTSPVGTDVATPPAAPVKTP